MKPSLFVALALVLVAGLTVACWPGPGMPPAQGAALPPLVITASTTAPHTDRGTPGAPGPFMTSTREGRRSPAVSFGAQLVLLQLAPGREAGLAAPLMLHTRLSTARPEALYLASGTAAAVPVPRSGLTLQVLDPDTTGQVYYLVDATAPDAERLAAQAGRVIYTDTLQLVLALPAAQEATRLPELPAHGVAVSRIDPGPLAPAQVPAAPLPAQKRTAPDPFVAALLPEVTGAELTGFMADLSGERPVDLDGRSVTFNSRYLLGGQIADAEQYLYRYYTGLGLATSYVNWSYGSYHGRNVIAEIPGVAHPERIWLVGGHFDDISNTPGVRAPGADDNGSGCAATMALAAVLRGQQFNDTIRFVNFSAEEFGEWGSKSYAAGLNSAGTQVMGYIDLDMIGWDGNQDRVVELHTGSAAASISLGQALASAAERYNQGLSAEIKAASASNFSDHSSFWKYGYPAVLAIENFYDDSIPRDRNPWYHTTGDLLSRVDSDYVLRYTRAALATVAELAGIVTGPTPTATQTTTTTVTPTPGATTTPTLTGTMTPDATPSATPRPPAAACQELVTNGDFEATNGWTFPLPDRANYTSADIHAGARAARFGLLPGQTLNPSHPAGPEVNLLGQVAPAGATYASAYQTIAIPADAKHVTLAFWYKPGTTASAGDFQRVLLLDPANYGTLQELMKVLENSTEWRPTTRDLSGYRGRSVVIYFETYNDGLGGRTWLYLDDVSVQACKEIAVRPGQYVPLILKE